MKLTSAQKFIAIVVGLVLIAALIVFLLVWPQAARLADLQSSIDEAAADAESARILLEQRQAIKARSAETESQLLRLANQLPENPELPTFIIELQDVVNESGLEFARVTPSDPVPSEQGYDSISVELVVNGEWPDIVDLLQRLRRITRQVRIERFEVATLSMPGSTAPGEVTVDETEQETLVEGVIFLQVYTLQAQGADPVVPPAAPAE